MKKILILGLILISSIASAYPFEAFIGSWGNIKNQQVLELTTYKHDPSNVDGGEFYFNQGSTGINSTVGTFKIVYKNPSDAYLELHFRNSLTDKDEIIRYEVGLGVDVSGIREMLLTPEGDVEADNMIILYRYK